ncbi:MAG: hypothetical protein ACP5NS_00970 [Candidatus Pacearchaeota archaeon]
MTNKYLRGALVALAMGATGVLGYITAKDDSRDEFRLSNEYVHERNEPLREKERVIENEPRIISEKYSDGGAHLPIKNFGSVPSLEKVLTEYVPSNWTTEEGAFYRTAIEQLTGSTGVYGAVKLFEGLKLEESSLVDGRRVWKAEGGTYSYVREHGRHKLEIAADDGSSRLEYQVMTDEKNQIGAVIGDRWLGDKDALSYTIHPGQIKDTGNITLGASKYSGKKFGNQPLWEDWTPRNEYDNPTTSADAVSILKNQRLDDIFSKFR